MKMSNSNSFFLGKDKITTNFGRKADFECSNIEAGITAISIYPIRDLRETRQRVENLDLRSPFNRSLFFRN